MSSELLEAAFLNPASVCLFGLILGSFLNVLIHRLPRHESIVRPGSHCPGCGRAIPWYHNLPLVSWLALGGRCAGCKTRIALRYPLVELLAAVLLLAVRLRMPQGFFPFLAFGFYALAMLAMFFTDLEEWMLPDAITYPGIALGLLYSTWNPLLRWPDLLELFGRLYLPGGLQPWFEQRLLVAAVAAGVGYGSLWLLDWLYERVRKEHGMGMGDFKLAAMIGAFTGLEGLFQVLLVASLGGTLVGLAIVALRRGDMRTALPFGCFLTPAAVAVVLFDIGALWAGWQDWVARALGGPALP